MLHIVNTRHPHGCNILALLLPKSLIDSYEDTTSLLALLSYSSAAATAKLSLHGRATHCHTTAACQDQESCRTAADPPWAGCAARWPTPGAAGPCPGSAAHCPAPAAAAPGLSGPHTCQSCQQYRGANTGASGWLRLAQACLRLTQAGLRLAQAGSACLRLNSGWLSLPQANSGWLRLGSGWLSLPQAGSGSLRLVSIESTLAAQK